MRGERNVAPGRIGLLAVELPFLKRLKEFVRLAVCGLQVAALPRRPTIHNRVVEGQVAGAANFGIEEEEQVHSG